MRNKYCVNCYYSDKCDCSEVCKDYTPLTEEAINEEVDNIIESNRATFYDEWFEYIANFNS